MHRNRNASLELIQPRRLPYRMSTPSLQCSGSSPPIFTINILVYHSSTENSAVRDSLRFFLSKKETYFVKIRKYDFLSILPHHQYDVKFHHFFVHLNGNCFIKFLLKFYHHFRVNFYRSVFYFERTDVTFDNEIAREPFLLPTS